MKYTFLAVTPGGQAVTLRKEVGDAVDTAVNVFASLFGTRHTGIEYTADSEECLRRLEDAYDYWGNPTHGRHSQHNATELARALRALGSPVPTKDEYEFSKRRRRRAGG